MVVWTVPIPEDSLEVNLNAGEAILQLGHVCDVFDVFAVPNSFDPSRGLGFVGAVVKIPMEPIISTSNGAADYFLRAVEPVYFDQPVVSEDFGPEEPF